MAVNKYKIKSVVNHYTTVSHVPDIVEISYIADLLSALIFVCVGVCVCIHIYLDSPTGASKGSLPTSRVQR